jgi:predicted transcriptional regulator
MSHGLTTPAGSEGRASQEGSIVAKKVTMNLPDDALEAVQELARARGVTATEAIRQALQTERLLRAEQAKGNSVLIKKADGSADRIIFR